MTILTSKYIGQTYGDILTVFNYPDSIGQGLQLTDLRPVQDGLGNNAPMQICQGSINFITGGGTSFKLDGVGLTATATNLNLVGSSTPSFAAGYPLLFPTVTTSERPASPIDGMILFNPDVPAFQGYYGGTWVTLGLPESSNIAYQESTILPSALYLANSIPILILPGLFSGSMYHIHQVRYTAIGGSSLFEISPNFQLTYGSQTVYGTNVASSEVKNVLPAILSSTNKTAVANGIITQNYVGGSPIISESMVVSNADGQGIFLMGSVDAAVGDSSLRVSIWYSILELV